MTKPLTSTLDITRTLSFDFSAQAQPDGELPVDRIIRTVTIRYRYNQAENTWAADASYGWHAVVTPGAYKANLNFSHFVNEPWLQELIAEHMPTTRIVESPAGELQRLW